MLGGGLGALCRFACSMAFGKTRFAWATLCVNVVGSTCMGALLVAGDALPLSLMGRSFLIEGLLGGLTTFSTFAVETFTYLRKGCVGLAFANILANALLTIGGVWCGYVLVGAVL